MSVSTSYRLKFVNHHATQSNNTSALRYKPCPTSEASFLGRGLAPYKKRDNTACLRVNSHNPYCLFFCMSCSFRARPQRESNPQLTLRVQVCSVNPSQGMFILVKESLDCSNFPVIYCQNKKIEIQLCKTLFAVCVFCVQVSAQ